jgi:hypothetical protein
MPFQPKFNPWTPTNTVPFTPQGEGIGPGELKLAHEPSSPWYGAKLNGGVSSFDLVLGDRRGEVKKLSYSSYVRKDGTRKPSYVFRTGADSRAQANIIHRIVSCIWWMVDNEDAPISLKSLAKEVLDRSERGEIGQELILEFKRVFYPIVDTKIQSWFDEMETAFVPSQILSGKDEVIFVDGELGWRSIPADQYDRCFVFYRISQGTIRFKWIAEPIDQVGGNMTWRAGMSPSVSTIPTQISI